jgi:hypothetical protein
MFLVPTNLYPMYTLITRLFSPVMTQVAYDRSDLDGVDIFDVDVTGSSRLMRAVPAVLWWLAGCTFY